MSKKKGKENQEAKLEKQEREEKLQCKSDEVQELTMRS